MRRRRLKLFHIVELFVERVQFPKDRIKIDICNMFCSNSFNIYISRVFYRIPLNAPLATFDGKRNKARPRLCWIDSINKDIAPLGLTLSGAMNRYLTNDQYMYLTNDWYMTNDWCLTNNQGNGFIYLYPLPPIGWYQELMRMIYV